MNIFSKQAYRKPAFSLLMVLLLSLSIALSCIGYSAWNTAKKQEDVVTTEYTTIAVPVEVTFNQWTMSYEEFVSTLRNRTLADLAAQEAPQLKRIDRRGVLSAYIPGSKSLSSGRMDPAEYNIALEKECYNLSVFALRCEKVNEDNIEGKLWYDVTFSVEEVVSLSDAYDCFPTPDIMEICSYIHEENGDTIFHEGKTYLVFGGYQDYRVYRSGAGYKQIKEYRYLEPFPDLSSNIREEPSSLEWGERSDGLTYQYLAEGQIPWVCEYEGTVAEFLASEEASVWNEVIFPICRMNQESAAVMLTDSVQSMYTFNTGEVALLSGRFFTNREYEEGADVCIISAAYADVNNLQLGDALSLDLYDSGFSTSANGALANSLYMSRDPGPYYNRYCMTPKDSIGVCKEYEIVGIYTGAGVGFGGYHFNADMIFVPKASIPNAEEYEHMSNSLLNSFILENGSEEAFEAYMEEQGLGGMFMYFNQEFTSMEESLDALEENAMRLMLVGSGAFVLVCVLFLFLNFRRMNPVIRGVRLLGRDSGVVFLEVVTVLLLLGLFSIALGAGMSVVLFDTIMEKVLSGTLAFDVSAVLIVSAAAFVCYALASVVSTAIAVRKNLMKRK